MPSSRATGRLSVTFDDERLVDHSGLVLPVILGRKLALSELISQRLRLTRNGAHASEKVLTIVHAMLAGAGCIDDVDLLRAGATAAVLGHRVVAPSTIGTFLRSVSLGHVRQLDAVAGELFARASRAEGRVGRVVVDIDSTICETYGLQKDGARKVLRHGRRGYHPLLAATSTGEVVHARLRRGRTNDGSGAARFVAEPLARLERAGAEEIVLRADSGFYQADVIDACRRRGVAFSIGARVQKGLSEKIAAIAESAWVPIDYPVGEGAAVAEISWLAFGETSHGRRVGGVELRCIVRRVPPSPGIEEPLFPLFSYHPFVTNQEGEIKELDAFHREHAVVENVIKDLKHNGALAHLPSGSFGANSAWLVCATIAHNLARFVDRLGFHDGTRTQKTLRRRVLSIPGRITTSARRRTLHLPARWPWAEAFLAAWRRLASLAQVT